MKRWEIAISADIRYNNKKEHRYTVHMLSIHKTKLIAAILLILTGIFFAGCAGENPAVRAG